MDPAERARLDSWKEIARYLRRDVRTAIRWEQQRGLPVHRVPGGRLSRVFAYSTELDEWLANRPNGSDGDEGAAGGSTARQDGGDSATLPYGVDRRAAWQRLLLVGAVGAVVTIAATMSWALRNDAGPPRELTVINSELRALDASGRVRWIYRFDSAEVLPANTRWRHIGDLDRDGREDVVASLNAGHLGLSERSGQLATFTADGTLRWSRGVEDRVTFGDGEYGPPWAAADLAVYRVGAEARIAWALHHFTWWPGLLVTYDAQGTRVGTFVNAGWIHAATPSPDGRYLLVAGVTNSRRAYFVAVLDAAHPSGRAPELPGSAMECLSCPPDYPLHYFVLPRTDVSQAQPFPIDGPTVMTFADGAVQVHALEAGEPQFGATIYELSPDLVLRSARFSDSFWEWHRRLEQQGRLNHRAEECPERRGLDVRHWTPGAGWETVRVSVH